ncbi:MarC family protein [Oceanobacter mangrovi]|uniref:MarC family protein n=1 Tax=Oceanobacter mangrovi TaxID=2862510 RepID=UPI001C8EC58F|nr:MarC family protein [Oceanobacter mangrovi]
MLDKFVQDALILWATIDPIGSMALFAGLTANMTAEARRRTAIKTILYSGGVLIAAIVVGQLLLAAMGIQLVSLQLAGGIILFLFGLQMIFGDPAGADAPMDSRHDIAVFPLAIPATASPGAILAVILLTDNSRFPIVTQAGTALVLIAILAVTLLLLLASGRIIRVIGTGGANILVKVMGMVLAALSVELVMKALDIGHWGS